MSNNVNLKANHDSFQMDDDSDLNNMVVVGKFISRNHLVLNMILSVITLGCFFLSFNTFWYCEDPHIIRNSSAAIDINANSNLIHNHTCYTLFSIQTVYRKGTQYITRNIADGCPDISQDYPNRSAYWTSRKVYIYAAIGFLIIKATGLMFFIYALAKVYWWWFVSNPPITVV